MIRHGFVEKDISPEDVYSKVKELLIGEGFKITSEDVKEGIWDLHARKSSAERIVLGRIRDVDVVIAGSRGKFEVQLHAGIWGRDVAIPAIEGIATLGVATAAELHSGHDFEKRLWREIVADIDPTLKICDIDGLLFKTQAELDQHMKTHQQQQMMAQSSMLGPMAMMGGFGMMGMMGMGMMGGFGGPGLWI
ncbi:MAG: hypothetical protein KIY12_04590 [Thermoplasmata archaeon]|uniref:Uncharacterized protein n=1 Tax=Candidatus Sysuiplasma superficiale TaxID=2823368 RepID=A0A8J7YNH1_9ARCH|nr:hypothetical protein [Candidatus Sysuiplasma superficiale]MBX8643985.1 hypothetical protein [Candidatus Sysuiplasma superficiale]